MFNRSLRASREFDLTVGFDMDGYRIARAAGHVASLKGVIADEVRFESGLTRLTMSAAGALRAAACAAGVARVGDQRLFGRTGYGVLRPASNAPLWFRS